MPDTDEINILRVSIPQETIYVRFKFLADETFLTCFQIHDEEAVQVSFITVTFHALPGNVFTIGRVLGIRVIAFVFFGDIVCLLGCKVVDINIRVGGDGVCQTGLLAAGISHFISGRTPCQLLDATPRSHWAFVRFAFQYILYIVDTVSIKIRHKRVRGTGHPFIPMLIHQVGDDDTRRFRQVGIFLGSALFGLHLCYEKQLLAVGRERITFDVTVILRQLFASAAVRIHFP